MRFVLRLFVRAGVTLAFSAVLLTTAGRGPRNRLWENFRVRISKIASRIDRRAGPREIREEEKVGRYSEKIQEIEDYLKKHGFTRNPLSRVKTLDGETEDGSWVKRENSLSKRQLHIMLFKTSEETEIYAHEEYSSMNPLTAIRHYQGTEQKKEKGVKQAEKILKEL
ncbi:MAG: hypothetical protein ABEJ36_04675 [Candidatus Nanosalina sp.]